MGHPRRNGFQRIFNGVGAVRLFVFEKIPAFACVCRPVRVRRRRNRRGSEQLRGAALQGEAHELAALFLGRGYHRQSVHYGLRA